MESLTLEQVRTWYDKAGLDKIDLYIKPLVKFLNTLPGCATICSCAGYGPIGKNRRKVHPKCEEPYIWMVCRNTRSMFFLTSAARDAQCEVDYNTSPSDFQFIKEAQEDTIGFRFYTWSQVERFEKKLREFRRKKKKEYEVY